MSTKTKTKTYRYERSTDSLYEYEGISARELSRLIGGTCWESDIAPEKWKNEMARIWGQTSPAYRGGKARPSWEEPLALDYDWEAV